MMNNYSFKTIIWNKGDKPEKSIKRGLVDFENKKINDNSLSLSSSTSTSINIPVSIYKECNNKRQDSSNKISERHLLEQRGQNPFITHTSYINDIETQHFFLMPKCSNEHPKNRLEYK